MESPEKKTSDSSAGTPFPSARYFQIRFEYVHEVLAEMKLQLDRTNAQLLALHARLDTLAGKSDVDTL